jgi:hypothetical protein
MERLNPNACSTLIVGGMESSWPFTDYTADEFRGLVSTFFRELGKIAAAWPARMQVCEKPSLESRSYMRNRSGTAI